MFPKMIAVAMLLAALCLFGAIDPATAGASFLAVGMALQVQDAELSITRALPANSTAVTSTLIPLGHAVGGEFHALMDVLIEAPALTTGRLADDATMKYTIVHSNTSSTGDAVPLFPDVITQTGASSSGAAAATFQCRLPANVRPFVGVKITPSANADASAVSATFKLVG